MKLARKKTAQRAFCIRIEALSWSTLLVTASTDGRPVTTEPIIQANVELSHPLAQLGLRLDSPTVSPHIPPKHLVERLADALGRTLFPPPIAQAFEKVLADALLLGQQLALVFQTSDPRLLRIPFEVAKLPHGRQPSRSPGVRTFRLFIDSPVPQNRTIWATGSNQDERMALAMARTLFDLPFEDRAPRARPADITYAALAGTTQREQFEQQIHEAQLELRNHKALLDQAPNQPARLIAYGQAQVDLGLALGQADHIEEATRVLNDAVRTLDSGLDDANVSAQGYPELALACRALARIHEAAERYDEAIYCIDRELEIWKQLLKLVPFHDLLQQNHDECVAYRKEFSAKHQQQLSAHRRKRRGQRWTNETEWRVFETSKLMGELTLAGDFAGVLEVYEHARSMLTWDKEHRSSRYAVVLADCFMLSTNAMHELGRFEPLHDTLTREIEIRNWLNHHGGDDTNAQFLALAYSHLGNLDPYERTDAYARALAVLSRVAKKGQLSPTSESLLAELKRFFGGGT